MNDAPPPVRAQAFEVILTEHCNLRCAGCDHGSPLLPATTLPLDTLERDLRALAGVYHAGEIKLVGGEPTLHPELVQVIEVARASGVADRITLVTNGVLLHRMTDEVWEGIDVLWFNRYPNTRCRMSPAEVAARAERHGVQLVYRYNARFRHTLLRARNPDEALVARIYRNCELAHVWSCHTLYDGRYYKCSPAPLMAPRLAQRGVRLDEGPGDAVRLHDNPALREQLAAYLTGPRPLSHCSYCLGTVGRWFPHHQLDPDGLAQWRDGTDRPLDELIDPSAFWSP